MFGALLCLLLLATANSFTISKERVQMTTDSNDDSTFTPIRLIYINRLTSWWGNFTVPAALGVPGFTSTPLPYNYVALTFWTYPGSALDAVGMWATLANNMGPNEYGTTTKEIQTTLKKNFTNAGVKLLVSAFGATQNPTSAGDDPVDCATKLAQFAIDNLFDGVDIDWEDTPAFIRGDGEAWLITLTQKLRELLPAGSIITHAPQGPYFTTNDSTTTQYPKGAYLAVHKAVGNLIDFYNVQFYNQGSNMYQNAQDIFNISGGWAPGTAINEIIASGIPATKIVLGKPASLNDASNSYMTPADIDAAIAANYPYNKWRTGVMFWQFYSDQDGAIITEATKSMMTFAAQEQLEKQRYRRT